MKRILLAGVMVLGLGLTSALAAQHGVSESDPDPIRVTKSVVFKVKKVEGIAEINPFLLEPIEVKDYSEVLREFNEVKEREVERKLTELRKQREEELERIAAERKQRELDEKRSQQLAEIKADSQAKPKEQTLPSRGSSREKINIEFTYYTAFCNTGCIGITATGVDVSNRTMVDGLHVIATDPNVIPLYSIVAFEHNGERVRAIALDTGGDIKGHRIDLLVSTTKEAYALGRNVKQVEIIRRGK